MVTNNRKKASGSRLKEIIKVACGQFEPQFGDLNGNLIKVQQIVEESRSDLIILPELCTSGYEFRDQHETEALALDFESSPEKNWLTELAHDTDTHIVIGLPERGRGKIYNSCALFEPSGRMTVYRKIHLFDREKNLFDPGDLPFTVVETDVGRIGMMICFDWIFPEAARTLALKGAQIICHPANLVLQFCQRAMFARSVENGVFTATCNRIGSESRTGRTLTFTGASQILSNRGMTLAQASPDKEEVIKADIKPSDADNKMITALNDVLKDRRMEFYPIYNN